MQLSFSSGNFDDAYKAGTPQVAWTEVRADTETPVSAFLKLTHNSSANAHDDTCAPYSFLLESVEGGKVWGRYSIIAIEPDLAWRHKDGQTTVCQNPLSQNPIYTPCPVAETVEDHSAPLVSFNALVEATKIDLPAALPPMASGLFGYMGYDMVRHMEKLPDDTVKVLDVPESLFVRPTLVLVFDRLRETLLIATPVYPSDDCSSAQALDKASTRVATTIDKLAGSLPNLVDPSSPSDLDLDKLTLAGPTSNVSADAFQNMVRSAKDYIVAGDIFQVVLSQRFELPFSLSPFSLYRSLRRINPSPYLFFLKFDDFAIAGSSPEVLVRLKDDEVTIRPIAGTRKRGADDAEDKALAADLLSDKKELAEHLMLLDLGRNDVGRVASIGSVNVTEEFKIELYSHVMHIVSNVTGQLAAGKTAMDALAAGFPAGTVSGAPKVRAMQIIDEFEPHKRGIYAGAVGYFDSRGEMDTCIALRTAVIKDKKLYIQAGAGVVADSDPVSEHEECCNKARALVRAAQDAVTYARRKMN
ncbi:MAG: anthranilate synthase component I [Alphaproteobacteria bacterium]